MSSTWGNSWLSSWGASWDGAALPPVRTTSGGAVIVENPGKRKRRKKASETAIDADPQVSREITEAEAQGMTAIYGAPFRESVADLIPEEIQEEAVISQEFEEIIAKSAVLEPILAPPIEPEVQQISEILEEEDDIALILAIIEAIG